MDFYKIFVFLQPILLSTLDMGECKHSKNSKSFLGQNQEELKTILTSIDGDGPVPKSIPTGFSSMFRPPSKAGSKPAPTLVYVSIQEVQMFATKNFVSIYGYLETTHNDSRLEYENLPGYNKKYINAKDVNNPMEIWHPKVSEERFWGPDLQLFNSEGLVYCRQLWSARYAKTFVEADNATITATVSFMDKRYFKEDVILEWNPMMKNNSEIVTVSGNSSNRIVSRLDRCHSSVNYGPFGVQEYSCLELKISLVPLVMVTTDE